MSVNVYKSDGTLQKIASQTNFYISYFDDVLPIGQDTMTWAKTSNLGQYIQSVADTSSLIFEFEDTVSSASSEEGVIVTIAKKVIGTGTDRGYVKLWFAETHDVPVNIRIGVMTPTQEV